MLEYYDKIKWSNWRASGDYDGMIFVRVNTGIRASDTRLVYGITVKDCMNTYLCLVMGVKPRFPVA